MWPNPYTNAAGDFFLMHRRSWWELRGYPELPSHSWIDGYLAYMAKAHGLCLKVFQGRAMHLCHQEHDRTATVTRPHTDTKIFYQRCRQMMRERRPLCLNSEDWGLGREELPEHHGS